MTELDPALCALGWNDWFAERVCCTPLETVARVAAVDRDQWTLLDAGGSFRATLAGRYSHHNDLQEERPCVGDWVCVQRNASDDLSVIQGRLERRTSLRRKSVGHVSGYQMIAANVDVVMIVQSCHFDFNPKRLERYLVMVREGGAVPSVLLTKTDLVTPEELATQLAALDSLSADVPVVPLSNVTGEGLEAVRGTMLPGKTYCVVGSSGVGKSTLINHLVGRKQMDTGTVSGTGEGRHTTVRRELMRLGNGALVIDNPGMREFGVVAADTGLDDNYADIVALGAGCRFQDCRHAGEPGCAVAAAVQAGEISQASLDGFFKLKQESAFNDLSYAQKRKKQRDFGRYLKSAKKDLSDR